MSWWCGCATVVLHACCSYSICWLSDTAVLPASDVFTCTRSPTCIFMVLHPSRLELLRQQLAPEVAKWRRYGEESARHCRRKARLGRRPAGLALWHDAVWDLAVCDMLA